MAVVNGGLAPAAVSFSNGVGYSGVGLGYAPPPFALTAPQLVLSYAAPRVNDVDYYVSCFGVLGF